MKLGKLFAVCPNCSAILILGTNMEHDEFGTSCFECGYAEPKNPEERSDWKFRQSVSL
jgi:Zn ribbon nucleic-acid-binding protein